MVHAATNEKKLSSEALTVEESMIQRQDERAILSTPSALNEQASESRIDRIARRAHEIYEARGGEHGKDLEDWLQAEREVIRN